MNINPFKQSKANWQVDITLYYKNVELLSEIFSSLTSTISYFEKEPSKTIENAPNDIWCLRLFFEEAPEFAMVESILDMVKTEFDVEILGVDTVQLDDQDWVSISQAEMKPMEAGDFYIYNSFNGEEKLGVNNIKIDPGRAFGTGEHETTSGCLELISTLDYKPKFSLDLGTGSGILALAVAKKFGGKIVASDIDPVSIEVASHNAKLNRISAIDFLVSDGIDVKVKKKGPYDLIVANILAKPIIDMVGDMVSNLTLNGSIILAGFLLESEQEVIDSFTKKGLVVAKILHKNHWSIVRLARTL